MQAANMNRPISNDYIPPIHTRLPQEQQDEPVHVERPGEDLPQGTQSEDVVEAVDATISPDATIEQRNAAYREVQAYVDRAAQGGDYEVIDDASMRGIAVHVQREHGVPTKYRQEVLDAVDGALSSTANLEQRARAYEEIQAYVDGVGGIGDAGITAEALPGRTATLLEEAGLPTAVQDARAEGQRILGLDGDEEKAAAFAAAYADLDSDAAREALIAEIFSDGSDPLGSWLDPGFVNGQVANGNLTQAERGSLAEAFAYAYNHGLMPTETVPAKPGSPEYDWQENPDHNIERWPLDGLIWDYAGHGYDQRIENAEQAAELLDFINSSDGPEVAEFRETYARHLIDNYVLDDNVQLSDDQVSREAAAGIAALLLGGDASRPEIAVNVLSDLTPEQRATFYGYAADSKNLFSEGELQSVLLHSPRYDYDEASVAALAQPDALATVIGAIADADGADATALAVELSRLPEQKADWFSSDHDGRGFGQHGYEDRANAMSSLFANHSDAILDELSEYDDSGARGVDDDASTDRKQYEVNGRDLSALLELTVFNSDVEEANRAAVRSEVLDYVDEQAGIIEDSRSLPDSQGYQEASGRLVVLSAATEVAVDRGFEQLKADREAQKEAIAFVVDLALAAAPLPDKITSLTSDTINELFTDNPLVKDALNGLTGEIIDSATGQLTDAAKEQLYENLDSDPELAVLFERQTLADAFKENILSAVADERDRADIQRDANSLADDISERD